jgi:hypothetical protein
MGILAENDWNVLVIGDLYGSTQFNIFQAPNLMPSLYSRWSIGFPSSWMIIVPNRLDSIAPELIIKQPLFDTYIPICLIVKTGKKRIKTHYYCCITINIHKLLIINQQGLMISALRRWAFSKHKAPDQ